MNGSAHERTGGHPDAPAGDVRARRHGHIAQDAAHVKFTAPAQHGVRDRPGRFGGDRLFRGSAGRPEFARRGAGFAFERRGERCSAEVSAERRAPGRFGELGTAAGSGERPSHDRGIPARSGAGRLGRWFRTRRAPGERTPVRIVALVLIACAALAAALAGCSTGSDAVAQGGTFQFVSPGGRTDIFYDPAAKRGTIGKLSGPNLLTNKTVSVNDFPNQVVVLNVWGQWCGPCRAEAPELEKVYEQSKARGVAFLGINVRDPEQDKAQDFVSTNHIQYPSIYDPEFRSLLALGGKFPTSVIPTTLVLDRHHRVAAVFLRSLLATDLQPVVDRLAAESA